MSINSSTPKKIRKCRSYQHGTGLSNLTTEFTSAVKASDHRYPTFYGVKRSYLLNTSKYHPQWRAEHGTYICSEQKANRRQHLHLAAFLVLYRALEVTGLLSAMFYVDLAVLYPVFDVGLDIQDRRNVQAWRSMAHFPIASSPTGVYWTVLG